MSKTEDLKIDRNDQPSMAGSVLDCVGMALVSIHIDTDLPCMTCGYNLRTLAVEGACPECGYSVRHTLEYGAGLTGVDHAAIKPLREAVQNLIALPVISLIACVLTAVIVGLFGAWALLGTLAITLPILLILYVAQAVGFVREASQFKPEIGRFRIGFVHPLAVVALLGSVGLLQRKAIPLGIAVSLAALHVVFVAYIGQFCRRIGCIKSPHAVWLVLAVWLAMVIGIVLPFWSSTNRGQIVALAGILVFAPLHLTLLLLPLSKWLGRAAAVADYHRSADSVAGCPRDPS